MQIARAKIRNRFVAVAVLASLFAFAPVRAHAVAKEIIQMQTQVQQLIDMVQRLQSTMDTRFAVLQNLAQQTTDEANKMGVVVNSLQQQLKAQQQAMNGKLDTTSGQMQSLNDSVDELKARVDKLNKSLQDLKSQLQTMQAPPSPAPGAVGPDGQPTGAPAAAATPQAPPLNDTFQAALRDFNAARYKLAQGEFQDVVHYYPMDDLAGSSQYYLGEIAYREKNYEDAISAYNAVLEQFSGNAKAPAAQLHKALALMKLNRRTSAIHEMRSLISRYPRTPEAAQARRHLNAMGARVSAR